MSSLASLEHRVFLFRGDQPAVTLGGGSAPPDDTEEAQNADFVADGPAASSLPVHGSSCLQAPVSKVLFALRYLGFEGIIWIELIVRLRIYFITKDIN
jgi:hypothetical protein